MKHIRVQVHPYLEYLNSILMTGRYNEMTRPCIGYGLMTEEVNEYTTHIRHFFKDHLNAPIYRYIENMIPNGFTFSRPVELMLCSSTARIFQCSIPRRIYAFDIAEVMGKFRSYCIY